MIYNNETGLKKIIAINLDVPYSIKFVMLSIIQFQLPSIVFRTFAVDLKKRFSKNQMIFKKSYLRVFLNYLPLNDLCVVVVTMSE